MPTSTLTSVFAGVRRSRVLRSALHAVALLLVAAAAAPPAWAGLPSGFNDSVVMSGRTNPTSVNFAPDGRIFVTEKSGRIWLYQSLSDTSPTLSPT